MSNRSRRGRGGWTRGAGESRREEGIKQYGGMRRHKKDCEMGRKRMKGMKQVEGMKSHHRNETTEEPRQISSL